jgi:uncharacterized membrane protein
VRRPLTRAQLILMAPNRSADRNRMTLEHDSEEVDAILQIRDRQIELLEAIKAETALVKQLVEQATKPAPRRTSRLGASLTECGYRPTLAVIYLPQTRE